MSYNGEEAKKRNFRSIRRTFVCLPLVKYRQTRFLHSSPYTVPLVVFTKTDATRIEMTIDYHRISNNPTRKK